MEQRLETVPAEVQAALRDGRSMLARRFVVFSVVALGPAGFVGAWLALGELRASFVAAVAGALFGFVVIAMAPKGPAVLRRVPVSHVAAVDALMSRGRPRVQAMAGGTLLVWGGILPGGVWIAPEGDVAVLASLPEAADGWARRILRRHAVPSPVAAKRG